MPLWSRAFHAEDSTAHKVFLADPHRRETGRLIGVPQFGLIAEQVEKVNPDLVVHDDNGKPFTVRYEAVNAMLLNEFLKEHRKVEEQQATIGELKSAVAEHEKLKTTIAQQQKQIEALTAIVQKVSDQVAISKPAPQLVANP